MEDRMQKLKTKSSAKKRFCISASGLFTAHSAYKRHNLRKRPQKMKRQSRAGVIISSGDAKNVQKYMPYC
ncbi:MAG: 50S ribosomal protein L35 [Holosporaceae bacterium]|nr:50S ribosomal protein L35 [Holosporaceae bacterium]